MLRFGQTPFCFDVEKLEMVKKSYGMAKVFQHIPNPLENTAGFLKAVFGNLVGLKKLYFLLAGIRLELPGLGFLFPGLLDQRRAQILQELRGSLPRPGQILVRQLL